LIARAVANETGAFFFLLNGTQIIHDFKLADHF
jgi:ATP-dependent 26S proteasome regulatory subunit